MKIEPRLNLLEIWRAIATWSFQDNDWRWGGRHESNSVSDAQQLLCLMIPATEIGAFSLTFPDRTDPAVLRELRSLGGAMDIPVLMVKVLHKYLDHYTDGDVHVFSGGSHFKSADPKASPTVEQQGVDVVESFAASLTLMLATLSFVKDLAQRPIREDLRSELDRLRDRASRRLTAAMVALLRSFTVSTFEADSNSGRALMRTINQTKAPERRVIEELRTQLEDVMVGLRDIRIGSGQNKEFTGANLLFECGWSWGVITGTKPIDFAEAAGKQSEGVAADEPYLYFTMVALDAIADLFSERTRRAELLDEEQLRLARALQARWDLTQRYWSVLAGFGAGRWPLEDVPWRATDDVESDYLTILVASAAMRDLIERSAQDPDLDRLARVLIELSNRARITRRPLENDIALSGLHDPGFQLDLVLTGEITGPTLRWPVQDYAAVLLKRTVRVASRFHDSQLQSTMITLADDLWEHLQSRRISSGKSSRLWDQPKEVFSSLTATYHEPSWQMTVRVVEALVIAASLVASDPLRSERLRLNARDMLSEAERLLDQELLGGGAQAGPAMRKTIDFVSAKLQRAREIAGDRPATAISLINEVLTELEKLAAAREEATWARR